MEPLAIIHEDERVLAVSKPAGQLVISGRGADEGETLLSQVSRHLGKKAFVVHRLDREASGLVLFAKDAWTHRELCRRFEQREVKKLYRVLVQGKVAEDGFSEQPIRAFGSGRMGASPDGKPSITRFHVLVRYPGATLLEVQPETGRRHQIRVHLYGLGHPVMGDSLYGKERPVGGIGRLMLHACVIELAAPLPGPLQLQSAPPPDFLKVLESFSKEA